MEKMDKYSRNGYLKAIEETDFKTRTKEEKTRL